MTATEQVDLGDFEGKPVLVTSVAVTNAGDGLSDALAVDPQILHQGDRGAILLEYEVAKVRFDPLKDSHGLTRVHILKASTGTLMDLEEARERLDAQRARIEEAAGNVELPFDGADGEPQRVGDVLEESFDTIAAMAQDAEDDQAWREMRMAELHQDVSKDELRNLASDYGLSLPAKATVAELVAAIVDHEAERGIGGADA